MPKDVSTDTCAARPREGTVLYYSLLPLQAENRVATFNLLKLIQVLADVLSDVQEPKVADQKIHWWHEEIVRLFDQQSRHPATQGCEEAISCISPSRHPLLQEHLLAILSTNSQEKYQNNADDPQFEQRLKKDYGARLFLLLEHLQTKQQSRLSTPRSKNPFESDSAKLQIDTYALGLGLFDRLRNCHRLRHRGYEIWPDSVYLAHGLKASELGLQTRQTESRALFRAVINQSIGKLEQAVELQAKGPQSLGACSLPLYINASLRLKQLKLWQKKQADPMRHYVALTPLQKAWHGMLGRRRFNIQH